MKYRFEIEKTTNNPMDLYTCYIYKQDDKPPYSVKLQCFFFKRSAIRWGKKICAQLEIDDTKDQLTGIVARGNSQGYNNTKAKVI